MKCVMLSITLTRSLTTNRQPILGSPDDPGGPLHPEAAKPPAASNYSLILTSRQSCLDATAVECGGAVRQREPAAELPR
jgi:hypothetical protein